MIEGYSGKFTAPFSGDTYTIAECGEFVSDAQPEVETSHREFPDTVYAMCPLGLSEDVFKADLQENTEEMKTLT